MKTQSSSMIESNGPKKKQKKEKNATFMIDWYLYQRGKRNAAFTHWFTKYIATICFCIFNLTLRTFGLSVAKKVTILLLFFRLYSRLVMLKLF